MMSQISLKRKKVVKQNWKCCPRSQEPGTLPVLHLGTKVKIAQFCIMGNSASGRCIVSTVTKQFRPDSAAKNLKAAWCVVVVLACGGHWNHERGREHRSIKRWHAKSPRTIAFSYHWGYLCVLDFYHLQLLALRLHCYELRILQCYPVISYIKCAVAGEGGSGVWVHFFVASKG